MHRVTKFLLIGCAAVWALPAAAQQSLLNDTVVHYGDSVKARQHYKEDPYAFAPVEKEPKAKDDVQLYIVYPPEAKRRGIEGRVFLRFKVLANGHVGTVLVAKSSHPILNKAAVEAIKRCHFSPGIQGGKPVAVWVSQAIEFRLK